MKKALIVIDLQNDYLPGGKMELVNTTEVLENTNKLIQYARTQKYKIYFIKHISTKNGATFFLPHTKGVELSDKLDIQNDLVIEKNFPNSFRDTILENELQKENIQDLVICGAMTHMCIDTTVRAAFDLGYNCTLVSDCCATKDLKFKEKIIKSADVQNSYLSALDGTFCSVLDIKDII
ncbi:MAG: cysteine hydrolase family protein [Arcobacteraceae bacterium]